MGEVASHPDVVFRLVEPSGTGNQTASRAFFRVERARAEAFWPGIGRFHLEKGREVGIEPASEVTQDTLRAFLLGPVLSILLYQRGFLVLHASVIALRDAGGDWGALGFLGHSGAGKSTMAAALHARGHRVVSDDVVAIPILQDGQMPFDSSFEAYSRVPARRFPTVFPAYPQLRLWPQTVEALGEDAAALPRLHPDQERRIRRVARDFKASGVPLRGLFVLKSGEELALERFTPAQALFQLVQHFYCLDLPDPVEAAAQFQKCGVLARTLPVFGLKRPQDLSRLAEIAALVETNWTPT